MSLERWLEHAEEQEEATRQRWAGQAPTMGDLPGIAAVGGQVERLIGDLLEAAKQIAVAGLAYPDPELPDELIGLAQRCRRHGVPTAVGICLRLRAWLVALSEETEREARFELSTGAFEETQRLLTWVRLFRVEHDLLMVQSRLAAGAADDGVAEVEQPETVTDSVSVWPVGLELARNGRLRIHARDVDDDSDVELHDDVEDLDPSAPMQRRAISRIFQDTVLLDQVMSSVIRLDDHPVVSLDDGTRLFRPAFKAVPKLRGVTDDFQRPILAEVPLDANQGPDLDDLNERPYRLSGRVVRRTRLARVLTTAGTPARVPMSRLMRFNLSKLLVREAERDVEVELTVVPRGGHPVPVALTTDFDGRVFPHLDPGCFRIAPRVLARRAAQDPNPPSTLAGAWLRAASLLLGGGKDEDVESVREHLAALDPGGGLAGDYRVELVRLYSGASFERSEGVRRRVEHALRLGVQEEVDVDPAELADVLGRDKVSAAELREVDGQLLYRAVWVALTADWTDVLGPALASLYTERFGGELSDPSLGDICCRALLMGIIGIGDDLDETEVEPVDEVEDGLRSPEGLQFLLAHLARFQAGRGRGREPLPSLLEVLQLGDTLARLTASDPLGVPVAALGLPPERLRTAILDALFHWTFSDDDEPETRLEAADALAVLAGSGLGPLFLA